MEPLKYSFTCTISRNISSIRPSSFNVIRSSRVLANCKRSRVPSTSAFTLLHPCSLSPFSSALSTVSLPLHDSFNPSFHGCSTTSFQTDPLNIASRFERPRQHRQNVDMFSFVNSKLSFFWGYNNTAKLRSEAASFHLVHVKFTRGVENETSLLTKSPIRFSRSFAVRSGPSSSSSPPFSPRLSTPKHFLLALAFLRYSSCQRGI